MVASVNQWGSLAEQIGGVHVKVTSVLSSTDVNAHDFEPKTDDIDKLQQAQVVVSNGAGYDTGPPRTSVRPWFPFPQHKWWAPSRETIRIYGSPVTPETPWPRNVPTHIAASCPRKEIFQQQTHRVEQAGEENRKGHEGVQRLA
ncbi:MAG: metal ABC transporter solute-binding protein, Zn/Mn family [Bifidobacterium sp.]